MKKFVLICDGKNFSKNTFDFVRSLYEKEPFLLVGAFFHSINYGLLIPNTFAPGADPYLDFTREEHDAYLQSINEFTTSCLRFNIEHRVHRESDEWDVNDLIKESRFADLVIVSAELFFDDKQIDQPNEFLRQVLSRSECPVLVVPEDVKPIQKIAIAYNGEKESMFALKMFCSVLPEFTTLPVCIDYWAIKIDDEIPDLEYLEEFAARHFPHVNFRERFFDPHKYLAPWLNDHKDTLFICGSFHRSSISNWFKKSFAEEIIKEHPAAVFIAHSCK